MELELEQKETQLLKIIGKEGASSQKEMAQKTGLSVGMINILVKKLVSKGYIKLSRLNKRNIQYLLTYKGFSEQIRLTNLYIQDTFKMVNNYRLWIEELLHQLIESGKNQFIVVGKSDLSIIVEEALGKYPDISFVKVDNSENISSTNMVILDCHGLTSSHKEMSKRFGDYINILEYFHKRMTS